MSSLKVSDVFCYICRGILIEPVTLPCFHVFCYKCFEQSMQETSHSCPLCRKRISNWIRSVRKGNNLIDIKLWDKIKEQFKEQVHLKINGEDDGLEYYIQKENEVAMPISSTGEVAKEFSKLLDDFKTDRERSRQAEELASRQLIEQLKEEEEQRLSRLREKNRLRMEEDERLAKMMQEEIAREVTEEEKRLEKESRVPRGPMDYFLNGVATNNRKKTREKSAPDESNGDCSQVDEVDDRVNRSDSADSLRMEMNLFRPIKKVLTTPPKRYPDGRVREINVTRVTPLKLTFGVRSAADAGPVLARNIHSVHSAFADTGTCGGCRGHEDDDEDGESSPKRLKYLTDDFDSGILKDITDSSNSSSAETDSGKRKFESKRGEESFAPMFQCKGDGVAGFDTQDYLAPSPTIEEKLIEEQKRIEEIILQEKSDRELALRLSREWESENSRKPQTRSMLANLVNQKVKSKRSEVRKSSSRSRRK